MDKNSVNYKMVSDDPKKSCNTCKHFKMRENAVGECFGNKVSSKGICNYFISK